MTRFIMIYDFAELKKQKSEKNKNPATKKKKEQTADANRTFQEKT